MELTQLVLSELTQPVLSELTQPVLSELTLPVLSCEDVGPWRRQAFDGRPIGVSAHRLVLTVMEQTGNIWMLDNVDR